MRTGKYWLALLLSPPLPLGFLFGPPSEIVRKPARVVGDGKHMVLWRGFRSKLDEFSAKLLSKLNLVKVKSGRSARQSSLRGH